MNDEDDGDQDGRFLGVCVYFVFLSSTFPSPPFGIPSMGYLFDLAASSCLTLAGREAPAANLSLLQLSIYVVQHKNETDD